MWKFALRRFLLMIPQIVILSVVVFFLTELMPGDALTGLIDQNWSDEMIEIQRELLGLNNPWYVRYWDWITGIILRGDFGNSHRYGMPVIRVIGQRLGNTIRLSITTLIFLYIIAIPLGIISGRHHDTWKDRIITYYTYLGFGMPSFILALLALFYFGFMLGWFPTGLSVTPGLTSQDGLAFHLSRLHHVILPALTVALISNVAIIQYLRGEIIDTEQKEFVQMARAKGSDESRVYNKHILRNSLLPIASFVGFQLAGVIGGSIFIETIFSFPGIGELSINAIIGRDFTLMTALILMFSSATILGSFLSDLIMMFVDPRIEIE